MAAHAAVRTLLATDEVTRGGVRLPPGDGRWLRENDIGEVQIFSGATGKRLRTITSTRPNENLGFAAVGIGDTNGNGTSDFLISAANRDTVYIVDGNPLG